MKINFQPYTYSDEAWAETYYREIKQKNRVLIFAWAGKYFHQVRHYWTHGYVGKDYMLPDYLSLNEGYYSLLQDEYKQLLMQSIKL